MIIIPDEVQPASGEAGPAKAFRERAASEHSTCSEQGESQQTPRQPTCPVCEFLRPGTKFKGTQKVPQNKDDAWIVSVEIQGYDPQRGYICGSMEAQNLPTSDETVVTFWEGEIVDNRNFTFITGRWDATRAKDMEHWSKFTAFRRFKDTVVRGSGKLLDLSSSRYIFMRWKEQFFVNVSPDCGLTIAGFYYVCFDRVTGTVEGYYHDANSSPWQRLDLEVGQYRALVNPNSEGSCTSKASGDGAPERPQGYDFPEYTFA